MLSKELGVEQSTVMMLAVQGSEDPLVLLDPEQVKASISSFKAANIGPSDIWFLVSKRPHLLTMNTVLQRWLDFLAVYGLQDKDLVNFLMRAPVEMLEGCTLFKAGRVINYLRHQLGIQNEFLAGRVFAVWPEVLNKDVETELQPIQTFLMQLGVEVTDIAGEISNFVLLSEFNYFIMECMVSQEWCAPGRSCCCARSMATLRLSFHTFATLAAARVSCQSL